MDGAPWTEWAVRALVALAARVLEERHRTCEGNWPAGQSWNDLGHTSQHTLMQAAREECGIPHEAYREAVKKAMLDSGVPLDEVWEEVSRRVKELGR
jgi:hypothetical protein